MKSIFSILTIALIVLSSSTTKVDAKLREAKQDRETAREELHALKMKFYVARETSDDTDEIRRLEEEYKAALAMFEEL